MPERFRFLINVDQCLNMSAFDIFFYKLKSQGLLMVQNASFSDAGDNNSLRYAASERFAPAAGVDVEKIRGLFME